MYCMPHKIVDGMNCGFFLFELDTGEIKNSVKILSCLHNKRNLSKRPLVD